MTSIAYVVGSNRVTHTGMRRTELLSLHRSQIDLGRSTILLLHTKNGKRRTVPIHLDIKPIFERLCEKAGPSGYLFKNPKTGKPIKDIKTAWRKALELAGIPHIPFHCAGRHTFGTRAAEGGAHPKDIQEIMDHVNIATQEKALARHADGHTKRYVKDKVAVRRIARRLISYVRR